MPFRVLIVKQIVLMFTPVFLLASTGADTLFWHYLVSAVTVLRSEGFIWSDKVEKTHDFFLIALF